jgi:ATP-dependent phosphoenolpyruvate carboxykinase
MLADKMKHHKADAWLINTGWNGGAYGVGKRISLKYSRAIIDSIHSGELAKAEYEVYPKFGLSIPKHVTGVPSDILNPSKTWLGTQESYTATLVKLATLFNQNFEEYAKEASPGILAVAPKP